MDLVHLPVELHITILSYLDYQNIVHKLTLVNHHFNQLINGDHHDDVNESCQQLWSVLCRKQQIRLQTNLSWVCALFLDMVKRTRIPNINLDMHTTKLINQVLDVVEPFIQHLTVNEFNARHTRLNEWKFPCLLGVNCSSENVNLFYTSENSVRRLEIDRANSLTLVPKNLEALRIQSDHKNVVNWITDNSSTLRELVIDNMRKLETLNALQHCRLLEKVSLSGYLQSKKKFPLAMNVTLPNLKELKVTCAPGILASLLRACPNIEILKFGLMSYKKTTVFTNVLTHLKYLSLSSEAGRNEQVQFLQVFLPIVPAELQKLKLSYAKRIRGPLSSQLQHLTNIRSMKFNYCSSEIIAALVSLSGPSLQELISISANKLQVSDLQAAVNLRYLKLQYMSVHRDETFITVLPQLRCLDLDRTKNSFSYFTKYIHENGINNLRSLHLFASGKKKNQQIYMLPKELEEISLILVEISVSGWILSALACHYVPCASIDVQDDANLVMRLLNTDKLNLFTGYGSQLIFALKQRVNESLNGTELEISAEEREKLLQEYAKLFESEQSFVHNIHKYSALHSVYKTVERVFNDFIEDSLIDMSYETDSETDSSSSSSSSSADSDDDYDDENDDNDDNDNDDEDDEDESDTSSSSSGEY